jgi:hypothetical protein
VRVLRPPTLLAGMSTSAGGEVRYRPALIEVSGERIVPQRLSTAGDHIDVTLSPERHALESGKLTDPSSLTGVGGGDPLPLPTIPGLPSVSTPSVESAPTTGPGTKIRITLGDVRQATRGHAIAAKATAIKVAVTQSAASNDRTKQGYAAKSGNATTLALGFGLLEVAAVAPERAGVSSSGAGGGLPVTGPRLDLLAMAGAGLLALGAGAVFLSSRRRRPRA